MYALKLGTVGFGGPVALVGYMHRDLVDIPTLLLAVVTAGVLWKTKKIPEPAIAAVAAVIGIDIFPPPVHRPRAG